MKAYVYVFGFLPDESNPSAPYLDIDGVIEDVPHNKPPGDPLRIQPMARSYADIEATQLQLRWSPVFFDLDAATAYPATAPCQAWLAKAANHVLLEIDVPTP